MDDPLRLDEVPISWIEHFAYCERQWALIALEHVFDDDEATTRGHLIHRAVDQATHTTRGSLRIERALPIWSEQLGLIGKADVVEFRGSRITPVEYKAGSLAERPQILQVTAQAMCLEEMFAEVIEEAVIYLAACRERVAVAVDAEARSDVRSAIERIRKQFAALTTPKPVDDTRCVRCSLNERCLPSLSQNRRRVAALNTGTWAV